MHADVAGDVAQHQRLQVFNAMIQKISLKVDDARRDLVNRLLALLDRLDEPERRSELVFHVGARLGRVVGALIEQPAVHRADVNCGKPSSFSTATY